MGNSNNVSSRGRSKSSSSSRDIVDLTSGHANLSNELDTANWNSIMKREIDSLEEEKRKYQEELAVKRTELQSIRESNSMQLQNLEENILSININNEKEMKQKYDNYLMEIKDTKQKELSNTIVELNTILLAERTFFMLEDTHSHAIRDFNLTWDKTQKELKMECEYQLSQALSISEEEHTKIFDQHIQKFSNEIKVLEKNSNVDSDNSTNHLFNWLTGSNSKKKKRKHNENSNNDDDYDDSGYNESKYRKE